MERLIRANALFLRGRHKEAFDAYMDIIYKTPSPRAASNLGYMYHRGIAVERNYQKAMSFYTAASYGDGGVSYFNMALMYLRGLGVEVDFVKAVELMTKSADMGCADACNYIALAYLMGCVYDPQNIECITLIPFYRVIYRDADAMLLEGGVFDPALEDKRYEVIDASMDDAQYYYKYLLEENVRNPYTEERYASAMFMLGKMYIEGAGQLYDPETGYKTIERAAVQYRSDEAARFLLEHPDTCRYYKIRLDRIERLYAAEHFKVSPSSRETPGSHRVERLLPKKPN